MNNFFTQSKLLAAPIILSVALTGCGGDSKKKTTEQTSSTVSITGVVAKGVVQGAAVTAYALNANGSKGASLGTGVTEAGGRYSITLSEDYTGGPLKVEVTHQEGATMKCDLANGCGNDSGGNPIGFGGTYTLASGFTLSTLKGGAANNDTVNVTAVTTYAAKVAEKRLEDSGATGAGSTVTNNVIALANSEVADLLEISTTSSGDLTSLPVIDITDETVVASASADSLKYAAIGPAIVDAVRAESGSTATIETAITTFVDANSDGSIKGSTEDAGATDLKEIFEATEEVIAAADETFETPIENLNEVNTDLASDVTDAETAGETEQTGTASGTTLADNLTKAKEAVAQIRELGRVTFMDALDGENSNAGAATAFQSQLSAAEAAADSDYVLEATGAAIVAMAELETAGVVEVDQDLLDNNGGTGLNDFSTTGELFATASADSLALELDEDGNGTIDNTISFDRTSSNGLEGTWRSFETGDDLAVLSFFDDGTYVHVEVDFFDSADQNGMEWGTFSIDSVTGQLSATQTFDGNADTGLNDLGTGPTTIAAQVFDDLLTLSIDENGDGFEDFTVDYYRVESEGIKGTFRNTTSENDFLAFTFFDDGTYIHMEVDLDDTTEDSGMEWGRYDRDAVNEVPVDDNGNDVVASLSGSTYTVNQSVEVSVEDEFGVEVSKTVAVDMTATFTNTVDETETVSGNVETSTLSGAVNLAIQGTATSADTTLTINPGSQAIATVNATEVDEDGTGSDEDFFDGSLTGVDVKLDATLSHTDSVAGTTSFQGVISATLDSIVADDEEIESFDSTTSTFTEEERIRTTLGLATFGLEGHFKNGTDEFNAVFNASIDGGGQTIAEDCTYTETSSSFSDVCSSNFEDLNIGLDFSLVFDANLNGVADIAKIALVGQRTGLETAGVDLNIDYPGVELDFDFDASWSDAASGGHDVDGTLTVTNMDGVKFVITGTDSRTLGEVVNQGTVSVVEGETETALGDLIYDDASGILTAFFIDGTFQTFQ